MAFYDARMPHVLRCLASLLFCLMAATSTFAQEQDSAKLFDASTRQLADLRTQLQAADFDPTRLTEFRDMAGMLAGQADGLIADRVPKLEAIDARLAELGEVPADGAPAEASDIKRQRAELGKQRTALDAEIKRAKLVVADGQQLAGEVAETRRALFGRQLSQRTSSPLLPAFWRDVVANSERDLSRVMALRDAVRTSLASALAAGNRVPSVVGLGIGILLLVFGRWWLEVLWLRVTADRLPQGRLRRSALAFAVLVISTLLPGLGAHAIYLGLNWNGALVEPFATLARVFVNLIYLGGLIVGLGRALLSADRPSWRLAPIGDSVALRLRRFPLLLAVIVVVGFLLNRVNGVIGTSLSATIAMSFVAAVLYSMVIAAILWRLRGAPETVDSDVSPRPVWIHFALVVLSGGVVGALAAATIGYVALAAFLTAQMIWISIVAGVFYVLVNVVEDTFAAMLSQRAKWVGKTSGISPKMLDQIAVLLSGLFRVGTFFFAIVVILAPLGAGPAELLQQGTLISSGITIGQLTITPNAILGAIAVFVLGMLVVRLLKNWLLNRYLPTTDLEPGMRSSITTLLGYVGGVLVFAFALSALGLSVERIAWVASALSVGIGFGLQAIVQNFISGLILLIERPVKVGDWIALGDVEGDIRRINVRATEIQMGDRSTVIVPNSELITKTVRNITLSNAEGRVRVRLPLPLECDARQVREIVMAALAAQPAILPKPEPSVLLDSIDGTSLVFFATAYIANPRVSGGVRSELLIDIVSRLQEAGIALRAPLTDTVKPSG